MADTIYNQLVKDGRFKTFVSLVGICDDLTTVFNAKDQLTVFAPTDEAFSKLLPGTIEKWREDTDFLLDVFRFHMVPGVHESAELLSLAKAGTTIKAVDNNDIKFQEKGGLWVGNDKKMAKVVTPDVKVSNGVIHVIDELLTV